MTRRGVRETLSSLPIWLFRPRFVIVGLLLTHGEFRSHHGPRARQYQGLTPGEVQRVAARTEQALPDFAFGLDEELADPSVRK